MVGLEETNGPERVVGLKREWAWVGGFGTMNGSDLPDGTYWFIIRLETNDKTIKGPVTIKR